MCYLFLIYKKEKKNSDNNNKVFKKIIRIKKIICQFLIRKDLIQKHLIVHLFISVQNTKIKTKSNKINKQRLHSTLGAFYYEHRRPPTTPPPVSITTKHRPSVRVVILSSPSRHPTAYLAPGSRLRVCCYPTSSDLRSDSPTVCRHFDQQIAASRHHHSQLNHHHHNLRCPSPGQSITHTATIINQTSCAITNWFITWTSQFFQKYTRRPQNSTKQPQTVRLHPVTQSITACLFHD